MSIVKKLTFVSSFEQIKVSFLTYLDTIELTVVRVHKNLDRIRRRNIMKGKKKALPIIDLQVYGRAFKFKYER